MNPAAFKGYLRHIDGLRGVSVLLVVLYHAWPDSLPGGFIGVDVFFVISGFLITRLLLAEQAAGTLGYGQFLMRRIRRLWPSFALVMAVTLLLGWVLLDTEELADLGRTALSAIGLGSNWYFALTTDYFNEGLARNLLLHSWSLAVEEQFYLVYPLLLIWLSRFERGVLIGLCALWGISFGGVLFMGGTSQAFFATHLRVWELASGALLWLAIGGDKLPKVTQAHGRWLARFGLMLIVLTAALMPKLVWWPSALALVPVAGACLCIGFPLRGLEARWLVGTGLISYALYLWHWPILKGLDILWPGAPDGIVALAIFVSIGLAYLAWRYAEEPIRRRRFLASGRSLLILAAGVSVIMAGIGWQYHAKNGFPERFPSDIASLQSTSPDRRAGLVKCKRGPQALSDMVGVHRDLKQGNNDVVICTFGDVREATDLLLYWGDSHLGAIEREMASRAWQTGQAGFVISLAACAPLRGLRNARSPDVDAAFCERVQDIILEEVASGRFGQTVLVSHWDVYAGNGQSSSAGFPDALEQTLQKLEGQTELHVLLDVPTHNFDVPGALVRFKKWPWTGTPKWLTRAEHERVRVPYLEPMQTAQKAGRLTLHDPVLAFCPDRTCLAEIEGQALFFDSSHVSQAGAAYIFDSLPDLPH